MTRAGSINSNKSASTVNSANVSKRGSVQRGSAAPSHLDADSQAGFRSDSIISADLHGERCSTVLGIGSIFNIRRKKKRGPGNATVQEDPTSHEVTFTITVSQAVPTDESEKLNPLVGVDREPTESSISNKKKKQAEAPKPIQYFHYAYHLIPPDDGEEETVADVVTFPTAAKVYGKGATVSENPGVKTWREGEKTWFTFQHNHKISVTKELLHKLFDHTLEVKVWNSREKVSSTTRFDRPKGFRFPGPKPGEDPEDIGGVKPTVFSQSRDFVSLQPKKYFSFRDDVYYSKRRDIYRMLPHEKVELEKKFADWADTNPELIPKAPGTGLPMDDKNPNGHKGLEESVYNMGGDGGAGGDREDGSPSGKIPHTIVGYQTSAAELEENMRTYSRLGRLAAASDRQDKPIATNKAMSVASSKGTRRNSAASRMSRKSVSIAHGGKKGGGGIGATSLDRAVDERNAHFHKYGLTSVSVRMSMLFAGLRSVTNRLDSPAEDVNDMFVTISLDDDLLNEQQREALNPMSIKIESTSAMPNTPMTYSELRKRCHPAYCRYKFGNLDWYKTPPKVQDRDIHWNDTNVVLLGMMDAAEVREIFRGGLFEVEIHDRDGRKVKQEKPAALFGEEPDDDKISSIALVANKRTVHNAFESKSTWDPFGVAKFDLSELLRGRKRLCLKTQIQQGPLPELLGLQTQGGEPGRMGTGQVVGNPTAVDGPVDLPLPVGEYLESGASMKLTVEITRLLATPAEVAKNELLPASEKCPFSRLVVYCEHSEQNSLHKVFSKIRLINSEALQLNYLPEQSIPAALKTYRLSDEQKTSGECDVITGVHVLDGKFHLLLLEGLRSGAITQLFEHIQAKSGDPSSSRLRLMFDSDLMFSSRLYASFGVSLFRVRIHESLSSIMIQPLLYVRDMVPKMSFDCLTKISQILQTSSLKDVVRNQLFPTVDMVKSMSKEFGIAYFQETNNNNASLDKKSKNASTKHGDSSKNKSAATELGKKSYKSSHKAKSQDIDLDFDDAILQHEDTDVKMFGSRLWTPLAMSNPEYEQMLRQRALDRERRNYVEENKDHVEKASVNNRNNNPKPRRFSAPLRSADDNGVYNYSSHTVNTTELSIDEMRDVLQQRYPGRLFTFMKEDFWNSGVMVPYNIQRAKTEAEMASRAKWMTKEGFQFPGMDSALADNLPERPLDEKRQEEINQFVWRENTLHEGQLKPALPFRDVFTWEHRKRDLDLRSKPERNFGMSMPETIMPAGDIKLQQEREVYNKMMKEWREKMAGRDPVLKFHRLNPATENMERGIKASNQIDKTAGLLKDSANRVSLGAGMSSEVPALGVVHYPSVDISAREAGYSPPPGLAQSESLGSYKGPFTLGDEEEKRMGNNVVSLRTQRSLFIDPTATHFRLINPTKNKLSTRRIEPLTQEEKNNLLFTPAAKIETEQMVEREKQVPLIRAS
ncbi:uncharacterized protein LOC134854663 [Symsagittifera roscoffensis]|uniref:uncharacterized protein LOC134854663 n=1 Tax=Symsagittifera roscoffensis TaxID=84072 RepID=UPI00307B921F